MEKYFSKLRYTKTSIDVPCFQNAVLITKII